MSLLRPRLLRPLLRTALFTRIHPRHLSSSSPSTATTVNPNADGATSDPTLAEQLATYQKAQRQYVALLERYNPGLSAEGVDAAEHVRRTARRVGLDLTGTGAEK